MSDRRETIAVQFRTKKKTVRKNFFFSLEQKRTFRKTFLVYDNKKEVEEPFLVYEKKTSSKISVEVSNS